MGMDEYTAHTQVAAVLEQAITAEALTPGWSGWRRTAANIAEAWLTSRALAWRGRHPIDVITPNDANCGCVPAPLPTAPCSNPFCRCSTRPTRPRTSPPHR